MASDMVRWNAPPDAVNDVCDILEIRRVSKAFLILHKVFTYNIVRQHLFDGFECELDFDICILSRLDFSQHSSQSSIGIRKPKYQ
jgi:hypothetical protein